MPQRTTLPLRQTVTIVLAPVDESMLRYSRRLAGDVTDAVWLCDGVSTRGV